MRESDYTDVVSQALQLKRTTRALEEAKVNIEVLHNRITAAERVNREASIQHATDIAHIERQRDEFRDLLQEKSRELGVASDRLESLQGELKLAHETITRLREEAELRSTDPFHIHVRNGNAYDTLLEIIVKSSGDRKTLVERYRNIETRTSNMVWQTFLEETMLNLQMIFIEYKVYGLVKVTVKTMVQTMAENEAMQPPFVRYVQRHLEYEEAKRKKMTKVQLAEFQKPLEMARGALVHAWLLAKGAK